MPYLNRYAEPRPLPEAAYHASTKLEEYDLNWVYGAVPPSLETPGGVRLVPLVPSIHGERLYRLLSAHPDSYAYLPYGPFETYSAFLTKLELARADPNSLSFAVYDLSLQLSQDAERREALDGTLSTERLAGIVGVKESNFHNRMIEIGNVHIPPPFQRTHVSTHAISLLLRWALDPPSRDGEGNGGGDSNLGLRRVQWFANPLNLASVLAAERLGFQLEAKEIRWERTLPARRGKVALELPAFLDRHTTTTTTTTTTSTRREVEVERGEGRHSSLLSIDWERWNADVSAFVDKLLTERPVRRRRLQDVPGLAL